LYRDRIKQDSIHIHDSIPVPYPVDIVKFTNKLTWGQQTQIYIGWVVLVGIGCFFLIKYKSKWLSFIVSLIKNILI